jgi:hypothetical protein
LGALLAPAPAHLLLGSFEARPLHIRSNEHGSGAGGSPSCGGVSGDVVASGNGTTGHDGDGSGGSSGSGNCGVSGDGSGWQALEEVRALTTEQLLSSILPTAARLVDAAPDEGAVEVSTCMY